MGGPGIDYSMSGGGFFFSGFSKCAAFPGLVVTPDVGAYGVWAHGVPAFVLPHRARFIQVDMEPSGLIAGPTFIQLGTGPIGSEILWQPTGGNGVQAFTLVWTALFTWHNPYSITFPSSLLPGTELCARANIAAGVQTVTISFYAFN
jgi:hypothetical protein